MVDFRYIAFLEVASSNAHTGPLFLVHFDDEALKPVGSAFAAVASAEALDEGVVLNVLGL